MTDEELRVAARKLAATAPPATAAQKTLVGRLLREGRARSTQQPEAGAA